MQDHELPSSLNGITWDLSPSEADSLPAAKIEIIEGPFPELDGSTVPELTKQSVGIGRRLLSKLLGKQ